MFCKAKTAKYKLFLRGDFRPHPNKNVQFWDQFFPFWNLFLGCGKICNKLTLLVRQYFQYRFLNKFYIISNSLPSVFTLADEAFLCFVTPCFCWRNCTVIDFPYSLLSPPMFGLVNYAQYHFPAGHIQTQGFRSNSKIFFFYPFVLLLFTYVELFVSFYGQDGCLTLYNILWVLPVFP